MREVHLFSRSFALNALERTSSHTPPRMTGDRKRDERREGRNKNIMIILIANDYRSLKEYNRVRVV